MLYRLLLVLLAIAALGLFAAAATAHAYDFPGQGPIPATAAPMVSTFIDLGERFWHDRDVQPCPPQQLHVQQAFDLDTPDAFNAYERAQGCNLWLVSWLVRWASTERPGNPDHARDDLCTAIFHGLGHTAGLGHTDDGGVMAASLGAEPWACRQWRHLDDLRSRTAARAAHAARRRR